MVSSVFTYEKHLGGGGGGGRKKRGKRERERVNWCFTSSQPVQLYQGDREIERDECVFHVNICS